MLHALLIAFLLAAAPAWAGQAAYTATILATPGLVGFWPLGDTSGTVAVDASSGGHNGAYNGGIAINQAGPFSGAKAITSTSTSHTMTVPDTASLNFGAGDFTAINWVNSAGVAIGNWGFMNKLDTGTFAGWAWHVAGPAPNTPPCDSPTNGCADWEVWFRGAGSQVCARPAVPDTGLHINTWTMLAVARISGTVHVRLYRPAATVTTTCAAINQNITSTAVVGLNNAFGIADSTSFSNFALFNVGLSDAAVDNLYTCAVIGSNCLVGSSHLPFTVKRQTRALQMAALPQERGNQ